MGELDRITQNPEIMGGKACVRGMRVTVGMIVGQIGAGRAIDEVLSDYPYLEREDIMQACGTPLGEPRSAKLCWPVDEAAGRHESLAALGKDSEPKTLVPSLSAPRSSPLSDKWPLRWSMAPC